MSAFETIEQIKELPVVEQVRVAQFIGENGSSMTCRQFIEKVKRIDRMRTQATTAPE